MRADKDFDSLELDKMDYNLHDEILGFYLANDHNSSLELKGKWNN